MEHVSKRFGDFYANRDINLSVRKGEVHTLLGENGAGKSTLMNVLIGLYQPTEGKIFLNGKEVRIDSPAQAVKLGIGNDARGTVRNGGAHHVGTGNDHTDFASIAVQE